MRKLNLVRRKLFVTIGGSYYRFYLRRKGVKLGGGTTVIGKPLVLNLGGKISIGNNVTLNSSNFGYHTNMYGPVKLIADRKNASIVIGDNTRIHGSCIHAWKRIEIGNNCLIAANCTIIDANGHSLSMDAPSKRITTVDEPEEITIGNDVWIGLNAIILKGVKIGEGSVVGAGEIVRKSIPANAIYVDGTIKDNS